MTGTQYISRKGNFDSGHRVMNERMKCFNIHGHTYLYELTFKFHALEDIGYAIDFKEIKRVFCQWIDDRLDHGMLLNPEDSELIRTCKLYKSKYWLMSLNGGGQYCNPSVENVAKEVFLAMETLTETLYENAPTGLYASEVKIYETPNCWTVCDELSPTPQERKNFLAHRFQGLAEYARAKGVVEYDDRKTDG